MSVLKTRLMKLEAALAPKGLGLAAKMQLARERHRDRPPLTAAELREHLANLRPGSMAARIAARGLQHLDPAR